ncbi:CHASE2 domain-containing protein, partial [bacterium]|nr:CHASE2 domain-containing protein [bacterium]
MRILARVLIGIGISLILLFTFIKGTWEKFELIFYDWKLKYTSPEEGNIPIVIVGITERFEKKTGEKFSRKFHSKLIKILQKEGVSL